MTAAAPLIDGFGRVHTNLRLSITDRCNIRCFYCMPSDSVEFLPRAELLTYEEIQRFVRVVARMGVNKVRITGGEPLVRSDVPVLIRLLRQLPGITDLGLTTNGIPLADVADELRQAGLDRVNISLDTLREDKFVQISRRRGLDRVLSGIAAAQQAGFSQIRLNAIAIRGLTEDEILPLADFARQRQLELRFIEFMPLDADQRWETEKVLSANEVRRTLETEWGPLRPAPRPDPNQPAVDFEYADGRAKVGFIRPVSEPFCGDCNRLRLTSEGQVRNCLFSDDEFDVRALLRSGGTDQAIAELVRRCVGAKKPGHGIESIGFLRPRRSMHQIGG